MDEKSRFDDWLRRRYGAGKRKTRADGGMTRRQQKRQPHVEREDKRDEMEAYQEALTSWRHANHGLIMRFWKAYAARKESAENYALFESLQDQLWEAKSPEPPDRGDYYGGVRDFSSRNYQRLKDGYPGDYGELIRYLRLDPYQFRSGYAKQSICRILKRAELSETEKAQIREVILQVAASHWERREFVEYARLAAARLGTSEFHAALEKIDGWKARLVLERLEQADRMRASREVKETPS